MPGHLASVSKLFSRRGLFGLSAALLLSSWISGTAAQTGGCGPSSAGSVCGGAGVASLGNTSGTAQGAGNPIHLVSGNKYLVETDMPALPGPLGVEIVRHYNSVHAGNGVKASPVGRGWRFSYDTQLAVIGSTIQVLQADGSRLVFRRGTADAGHCSTDDPSHGVLKARPTSDGEAFDWRWPDGRVLGFDPRGHLIQVSLPTGDLLLVRRDVQGRLLQVVDPQGRTLRFGYRPPDPQSGFVALAYIETSLGRIEYRQEDLGANELSHTDLVASSRASPSAVGKADPTRLVSVVVPTVDGSVAVRRYHHEDPRFPALITGVSVSGPDGLGGQKSRRVATYAYDANARGTLTQWGDERLVLNHDRVGLTTITDARGRVTEARHGIVGGEWRLLELRGHGCKGCGPAPMSMAYDALGRLVRETALDIHGRPLRSRVSLRDEKGRVEAVAVVEHRAGRAADPVWIERHRFLEDAPWPVESRYPSVIDGRDRIVETERDLAGQVLRIRESGFSPVAADGRPLPSGLDGRVSQQHASGATPILRETRLTYGMFKSRSRLVRIDGPLPNGPLANPNDSDITHLDWDEEGARLTRIQRPGGFVWKLRHDAAGRSAGIESKASGLTQWRRDLAGRMVERTHLSPGSDRGRAFRWTHDAFGQIATQTPGQMTSDGFTAVVDARAWRRAHDTAGHPLWKADAMGHLSTWTRSEDGVFMAAVHSSWMRLDAGTSFAERSPLVSDSSAALHRSTSAGAPRIRELFDDFGRKVAMLSSDHGNVSFGKDEADRMIWMLDAKGQVARYEYDLGGRVIRQQMPHVSGDIETRWSRQAARSQVLHPVQQEFDEYDTEGRLSERLLKVDPEALTEPSASRSSASEQSLGLMIHRSWRHDENGRLAAMSLADGSWLRFERNGQGQVVRLVRDRLATEWLRHLLPVQVLATDIERDLVDVSSIRFGNGIHAQWWRSADGRLVRLVHKNGRYEQKEPAVLRREASHLSRKRAEASGFGSPSLATLFGITDANAHASAPGWLHQPGEADALIDDRFGWDPSGNLVVREDRSQDRSTVWRYHHDAEDRLLMSRGVSGSSGDPLAATTTRFFAYDAQGRRVGSGVESSRNGSPPIDKVTHLHVDMRSNRLSAIDGEPSETDATGRLLFVDGLRLQWTASGQLSAVHRPSKASNREKPAGDVLLARYGYNHRGERVLRQRGAGPVEIQLHDERKRFADLDHQGRIARQWIFLADLPLAVIDSHSSSRTKPLASASTLARLLRDLQVLAGHLVGQRDQVSWLHTNHLGAPVAVTDERGRLRWQAEYNEFGRAEVRSLDGFELDLRLPGQHEDKETGFHHNDHRTYHPELGRYLTPDPLGSPDGPDPYAYVRHNPLRFVDPSGLVLWAFDGTSNAPHSRTNVWHFAQSYDGLSDFDRAHRITGVSFYTEGPGTDVQPDGHVDTSTLDAAFALSMNPRLDRQFLAFERYAQSNWDWHRARSQAANLRPQVRIDLDVVGFSRGAAMSREFSNRVSDYLRSDGFRNSYGDCLVVVQRLLALFDTVLSTNTASLGPHPLRMAIPAEVQAVFHAVAMNEHRGMFPAESIHASALGLGAGSANRVERGFIGAHADIGGGYNGLTADATGGDLSDLALLWMVRMAESVGVPMRDVPEHLQAVTNPIVHDELRSRLWRSTQVMTGSTDRSVRFRSPQAPSDPPVPHAPVPQEVGDQPTGVSPERTSHRAQRDQVWSSGMSTAFTGRFTRPRTATSPNDLRSADVDLCDYIAWLNAHYRASAHPEGIWQRPQHCPA